MLRAIHNRGIKSTKRDIARENEMIGINTKQCCDGDMRRAAAEPEIVADLLLVQPAILRELAQCAAPHSNFPFYNFGVQDH